MFFQKLKEVYSKNPIIVGSLTIIGAIAIIVTLWSFINLIWDAYKAYSTYDTGTQILIMTIVSILVNMGLILLVTAYLSIKIGKRNEFKE